MPGSFRLDVDFADLKQLQKKFRRFEQDKDKFMKKCLRELMSKLYLKTLNRTPVDTGLLKKSWKVGAVIKVGSGYEIKLENSADYSSFVEFGHWTVNRKSFVQGRFFLTISEKEVGRLLEPYLRREFEDFLLQYMR